MPQSLDVVERLAARDHYLAVVATTREDGTVQSSVVNAGIIDHPGSGERVVAFVTYGAAKKAHLRARPHATLTFRAGWEWIAVEGGVELMGPDDPAPDPERVRLLLREIYQAAGGEHDDWDAYDRVMQRQRRTAVLLTPDRIYSN
ncbi:TIGR03618 family F420-dependent PPOX class oxidoreductase [Allosaccharopolyspora coralli]|uniref:TIGR03618 family F420-dependent PPOX class oxidoreductase n=1 Tax=Allosaccharopolyspora coralli TaxID=2665642 RepID=A0A5Q3Q1K0_9PSEU|nr:TIGR03618 family F420-dependent PPOX class oxidoreductase [Allosaccharopolyspora coralli]QGK68458.1 TIGR03618 family F420-dependent PPOX class oxidoreductase [Allosaccharopolyspora coralli]